MVVSSSRHSRVSWRRRLRDPLVRQRLYLLVSGIGWLLYGVQVVLDPYPRTVRSASILDGLAPISMWGWTWIVGSVIAIVCALVGCTRLMWIGFASALYPPLLWGVAFAAAWATGEYPQAWAGAATWIAAAVRLMIVGAWPACVVVAPEIREVKR